MPPEKNLFQQPVRRAATATAAAALFTALGIGLALYGDGGHTPAAWAQQQTPRGKTRRGIYALRPETQAAPAPSPTPAVPGAPDPLAALTRMVQAERTLSYEAREATFGANRSTEEIVKHDPVRGVRRESIRPPGEIFVDDYHHSWILSTRNRRLTERPSLLSRAADLVNGLGRIKRGKLRAEWVGVEQVAGRLADIVSVSPSGGNLAQEPSRRFWVDQQSGLRLRSEDRGPGGRILSGAYYLTINLSPSFRPEDFAPPPAPTGFTSVAENRRSFKSYQEAERANVIVERPEYLPPGFRLRDVEVLDITGGGAPEQRITQRLDNGLSVLTLTQTTGHIAIPKALQNQLDKATGAGFIQFPRGQHGYVWHSPDARKTFLLIGSLPDDEMKRIADSMR